jgi:hypothetical protein
MKSKFKISGVAEIEHPADLSTAELEEIMKDSIEKDLLFTCYSEYGDFTSKGWCSVELIEGDKK